MTRPLYPWRRVVGGRREGGEPSLVSGRGSFLGPDTPRRARWWEMRLECGHHVERFVRYRPLGSAASRGGTQFRSGADVLPPPKRVRCEFCPRVDTAARAT